MTPVILIIPYKCALLSFQFMCCYCFEFSEEKHNHSMPTPSNPNKKQKLNSAFLVSQFESSLLISCISPNPLPQTTSTQMVQLQSFALLQLCCEKPVICPQGHQYKWQLPSSSCEKPESPPPPPPKPFPPKTPNPPPPLLPVSKSQIIIIPPITDSWGRPCQSELCALRLDNEEDVNMCCANSFAAATLQG